VARGSKPRSTAGNPKIVDWKRSRAPEDVFQPTTSRGGISARDRKNSGARTERKISTARNSREGSISFTQYEATIRLGFADGEESEATIFAIIPGVKYAGTFQCRSDSRRRRSPDRPAPVSEFSYSKGACIRCGGKYQNVSVAWQYSWLGRPNWGVPWKGE